MNKLLRVNLTRRQYSIEEIPGDVLEKYLGGKGLIAHYLYNELERGCDPLGPGNKLMFFCGPLTAIMPGHDRYVVGAKSPLTGTFSDSYAGGWFAVALRKAGYIGLIIEGKADQLVCLKIEGDRVVIEDADQLAGQSPAEVDRAFPDFRVAAIGIAGEKMVKYACVINNAGKNGRTGVAGRGGLGAVMGSKQLKAIAVKPVHDNTVTLRKKTETIRKEIMAYLKNQVVPGMGLGGNLGVVDLSSQARVLPVRNFQEGYFSQYTALNEDAVKKIMTGKNTCHLCPAKCGVETKINSGPFTGIALDRLEYENVAMGGSNCGHQELGPVVKFNDICNEYGLDTISAGSAIAFIMECSEKGIIDQQIPFGDAGKQMELLGQIARREGIGDMLAEGVKFAGKEIGRGAEELAIHVKGLEIPAYDPRGSISFGLSYGTADRGGCHMRAFSIAFEAFLNVESGTQTVDPFSIEGKAKLVKELQDTNAALWCLISCDNLGFSIDYAVKMLHAVGIQTTNDQIIKIGERICNLTQLFNHREGFDRKDDYLPLRFYQARADTGWQIDEKDYDMMLDDYYQLRQWNQAGKPEHEILEKLGLEVLD